MVDVGLLNQVLSVRNGIWSLVVAVIVAAFNMHRIIPGVMEQLNRGKVNRASIEGQQYERMAARLERLEESDEECQRKLIEALRRLAELEGFMMGQGKARQDAAAIIAAERADAEKAETTRKRFGGEAEE